MVKTKHTWTIENFRLSFARDEDQRRSAVFSAAGAGDSGWQMRLKRSSPNNFGFMLELVDTAKTMPQLRGEWKLFLRDAKNESRFNVSVIKVFSAAQPGSGLDQNSWFIQKMKSQKSHVKICSTCHPKI
jgi:hypothetical protein